MLIPSAYFRPDRVLIHASAFQAPSGKVIAIGGTGGVGKTSLELALCLHGDFRFVTDDICVLSESGHVWPILAPPKIYGYNTEHDRELRRKVLERRSSIDRLHWRWRSRRGSDRVRRRAPVDELYSSFSTAGGQIGRYLILCREARADLTAEAIAPAVAADLSVTIMSVEYAAFNRHVSWHEYNRRVQGREPVLRLDNVFNRWRRLARAVLENVPCHVVRVPLEVRHDEFKERMSNLIEEMESGGSYSIE
jgi:hypothetical protein